MICSDRKLTRTWFQELRRRASPVFELVCESVSDTEVEMLSMRVRIVGNRLITLPKPQPRALTLGVDSAHPSYVHNSWPYSYMRSLAKLCSRTSDIRPACLDFIDRVRTSGAPPTILDKLTNYIDKVICGQCRATVPRPMSTWLILKHHPAYEGVGLSRRIRSFLMHPLWSRVFMTPELRHLANVNLGFSNGTRHLFIRLRGKRLSESSEAVRGR